MTRLGSLALKTAAEAGPQGEPAGMPGILELIGTAGARNLQGSYYATQLQQSQNGSLPQQTNPAMLGMGAAQTIFGDFGVLPALALPFVAQPIKEKTGLDIMAPIRLSNQGSSQSAHIAAQINRQMMGNQLAENGRLVQRIAGAVGGGLSKLTGGRVPTEGITEWINGFDRRQIGQIYGQVAMAVPELGQALSSLDPTFISDFRPIIEVSMAENGGRFDPADFQARVESFRTLYSTGQFTPEGGDAVTAQNAVLAMKFAREHYGRGATMAHAINVAHAAKAFQDEGLANTFGAAMTLANTVGNAEGFMRNPDSAIQAAKYLGNMARQGMMDPQQIAKAADVAREQGIDPMTAMTVVARSGIMRTRYGANAAERLQGDATRAYANLQNEDWMGALEVAQKYDKRFKRQYERARDRGDVRRLRQLGERALRDRDVQETLYSRAQRQQRSGSEIMGDLNRANPRLVEGLLASDVNQQMRGMDSRTRSRFRRLMRDPDKVRQMYATGDFSGAGHRLGRMFEENPSLVASALTLDPSLTRGRVGGRVRSRIRAPRNIVPGVKPIPTLGETLGLGAPRTTPAAPTPS